MTLKHKIMDQHHVFFTKCHKATIIPHSGAHFVWQNQSNKLNCDCFTRPPCLFYVLLPIALRLRHFGRGRKWGAAGKVPKGTQFLDFCSRGKLRGNEILRPTQHCHQCTEVLSLLLSINLSGYFHFWPRMKREIRVIKKSNRFLFLFIS